MYLDQDKIEIEIKFEIENTILEPTKARTRVHQPKTRPQEEWHGAKAKPVANAWGKGTQRL